MPAVSKNFQSFRVEPQPGRVRRPGGPVVSHRALQWSRTLRARAERGRRRAEANGQSPEDMISNMLDKAAGED